MDAAYRLSRPRRPYVSRVGLLGSPKHMNPEQVPNSYCIVESEDLNEMQKEITGLLGEGWLPWGSHQCQVLRNEEQTDKYQWLHSHRFYSQAMIHYGPWPPHIQAMIDQEEKKAEAGK